MPTDLADFITIHEGRNAIYLDKSEFRLAIAAAIREWGASEVRKIIKEEALRMGVIKALQRLKD